MTSDETKTMYPSDETKTMYRNYFCNGWRRRHGLPLIRRKKLLFKRLRSQLAKIIDKMDEEYKKHMEWEAKR